MGLGVTNYETHINKVQEKELICQEDENFATFNTMM